MIDSEQKDRGESTIMTGRKRSLLNAAIAALEGTTGIGARFVRASGGNGRRADAIVEMAVHRRNHRFAAEVKTADRFETPAIVKSRKLLRQPLLVAPYITRDVAERCRQLRLPFIDTAGNAYLERAGLLIYVVGQARPPELRRDRFRALNPAGLRIVFALLRDRELIRANYRQIAAQAGVALGTVGPVMKDLEARQLIRLQTGRERRLLDPERMLEEWVTYFPTILRPKLNPRRFQADPERLQRIDLTPPGAYWGGEPAAARLTGYLKPAQFTIYASEPIAKVVASGRMRAEENGNVEILEKFWTFAADGDIPAVVPPILAYADLLATQDGRNVEAARLIYERRIAPAFDGPK
jgi:hypothetical protein